MLSPVVYDNEIEQTIPVRHNMSLNSGLPSDIMSKKAIPFSKKAAADFPGCGFES